ncbi:MAG: glycosyltransferase [Alphaproteobacteria bacterium]|nr:glycosyltransferase [Alphaproteobacteria bacterium SS10]
MTSQAVISLIIPAYNEARIIERTLSKLLTGNALIDLRDGKWQAILIANGCTDNTADIVRTGWPDVTLIELDEGSKTGALRTGAAIATGQTWIVMDADIEVGPAEIATLHDGVQTEAAVAAVGDFTPNLTDASLPVRLFYAAWAHHPYFDGGKFGGCYALKSSEAGYLLQTIPDITNDDEWMSREIAKLGQVVETDAIIQTNAPKSLGDLVRVRQRVYRGNRELEQASQPPQNSTTPPPVGLMQRLAVRPHLWLAGLCYIAINLVAKINNLAARDHQKWEQAERY